PASESSWTPSALLSRKTSPVTVPVAAKAESMPSPLRARPQPSTSALASAATRVVCECRRGGLVLRRVGAGLVALNWLLRSWPCDTRGACRARKESDVERAMAGVVHRGRHALAH